LKWSTRMFGFALSIAIGIVIRSILETVISSITSHIKRHEMQNLIKEYKDPQIELNYDIMVLDLTYDLLNSFLNASLGNISEIFVGNSFMEHEEIRLLQLSLISSAISNGSIVLGILILLVNKVLREKKFINFDAIVAQNTTNSISLVSF
ncbi:31557_t:CDS:2, partial [Gigaspora margarita]